MGEETAGSRRTDPGDLTEWDWESFYRQADYDVCAYLGGDAMPDLLARFFERTRVPDDVAVVGCGPALTEFELAERYPDVEFYGYDVSETVVRDNRDRAAGAGLENCRFAVDALPDLQVDRQFDLVYCVATLYFVREARRAVRALFERVRPGGYLVVNYPNRYTMWAADREFEGHKREAFELVIDGANLLSYDAIREETGRQPRSYWRLVGAEDEAFVDRGRPCVYVQR